MSDKNHYQAMLRSKIVAAIAGAKAIADLSHDGVKGAILEILIADLFKPLLPADMGVGTGHIIDSRSAKQSRQMDIVIYNKNILPPLLIDEKLGIFPVESVLYVIEIKTTLKASGIKEAHESVRNLRENFSFMMDRVGGADSPELAHYALFALQSDLTGNGISEVSRYKAVYGNGKSDFAAICVAGGEYWLNGGGKWIGHKDGDPYDGVLGFIGAIMNTCRRIAESRGYSKLGYYIIPDTFKGLSSIDH
jgi:hypothetical protein